ncbi:kelch-like protein, partial [Trifolium pratense]
MNCLRPYASVVEFNGQIYVFGGGDDPVWFDS